LSFSPRQFGSSASAYENGIVYVLLVDGLALALIFFAREIDDLTFGAAARGVGLTDRVDAHTPPFLIAMFGWLLLLFNTVMLLVLAWQGATRIG
jgi:hypothetical protein